MDKSGCSLGFPAHRNAEVVIASQAHRLLSSSARMRRAFTTSPVAFRHNCLHALHDLRGDKKERQGWDGAGRQNEMQSH